MAPTGLQAEEKEEIKATQLIQKITYLSQNLLPSVPKTTTDDKIYRVFTHVEDSKDDPYLPFNRKFDAVGVVCYSRLSRDRLPILARDLTVDMSVDLGFRIIICFRAYSRIVRASDQLRT